VPKDRFHYISLWKFNDPSRGSATEQQSSRDVFLLRLADVILIAAEAELGLNNKQAAADLINIVRSRAALSGSETAMQVTAADITIDFMLDERARELAGEQHRWFDLKRSGRLIERVKLYNPDAAANIQNFHIVRPIPQAQLDAVTNKGEFGQNTGY
jgi:hypothetical protein